MQKAAHSNQDLVEVALCTKRMGKFNLTCALGFAMVPEWLSLGMQETIPPSSWQGHMI